MADTEFPKLINYGTNDDRNVSHTAAATGNRHRLSGFQPALQTKLANLL
jgi:hypothetical protein